MLAIAHRVYDEIVQLESIPTPVQEDVMDLVHLIGYYLHVPFQAASNQLQWKAHPDKYKSLPCSYSQYNVDVGLLTAKLCSIQNRLNETEEGGRTRQRRGES
jgi:hypothetical protein